MTEGASSRGIFREVAAIYSAVIGVIIVCAILAQFVGFLGEFLYGAVALLFYFVPHKWIQKKGWKYEDFAIRTDRRKSGIIWGLLATAITVPFFMAGMWIWETYALGHRFEPDVTRYKQFSPELVGAPDWGSAAGVWVWSDDASLHVGLANRDLANNRVVVESSSPFTTTHRGAVVVKKDGNRAILTLTHSKSRGSVRFDGADDLTVRVEPVVDGNTVWPLYEGPGAKEVEGNVLEDLGRGYLWLILWIATQFLLVAFPEEYFYRGYIQTRLQQGFDARKAEGKSAWSGFWGFTPAIFIASFLFGIGHLLVPVGGAIFATRMMVFFPSLVFGWLRDKTDSILASTIYHTCCNLMVLVAAVHFV